MKQLLTILLVALAALAATGCSEKIPPGTIGKVILPEGPAPEIHQPGRVTVMWREKLVLLETASVLRAASLSVIMNDRKLNDEGKAEDRIGLTMDFVLNIRYRIRNDERTVNSMLTDMNLSEVDFITGDQVYQKYGHIAVGRVGREVLGEYTPEEVLSNLKAINATLDAKIKNAMKNTPLEVSSASLGPVKLPRVITDRINANKSTELSEAQKRAEQKIKMLEKENEIELAKKEAQRQLIDAKSLADQNNVIRKSITPEVLELRRLQVREKEIEMMATTIPESNSAVYIPYGSIDSTGANVRMFSK